VYFAFMIFSSSRRGQSRGSCRKPVAVRSSKLIQSGLQFWEQHLQRGRLCLCSAFRSKFAAPHCLHWETLEGWSWCAHPHFFGNLPVVRH